MRSYVRSGAAVLVLMMAALAGARPAAAQGTGTIRGTVTATGTDRPLAGVQVTVVNTAIGGLTDERGHFLLVNVPAGLQTIEAQMIGWGTTAQKVDVLSGETAQVSLTLQETAIGLEGLVVVGYGTQTRRELTGAVSSVGGQAISDVPLAGVDAALQGRLAGVQVTQNAGNPGNGITVRVRGSSSISAGNQPLWVVDGVPIFSEGFAQLDVGGQDITAVTGLNPEDIESIDILKDAAATAIYGSRGSNGVVVVTTKRGRAGASTMSFSMYAGQQEAARRLDLLNAREYLEYFNESSENDGRGENDYGVPGVDDVISTDWQDEILRTAPVTNFEVALSGGSDRVQYRVAGGYFNQEGIVLGSQYARASGRANVDFQTSDRLNFSASLALTREDHDRVENDGSSYGLITNALGNPPNVPVRNEDGSFTGPADGLSYPSSVALAELNSMEALTQRVFGNIEGRFSFTDALRLTSRFGFDVLSVRENQYESPRVPGAYAASAGGVAKSGYSTGNKYLVDNFLTFSRLFGDDHDITLTAGTSLELNNRELNFIRGEGLSSERFRHVRNAAIIIDADATESENNLVSFFGRGSYTFLDRYVLGASLRHDGSSRFGANNRYGTFPAVSAAWIASQESFLSDVDWMDELKLRASWGVTGNQAISNYPYQGLVGSANYGDLPGLVPSTLENPDLKWESTAQTNVGIDLLVFEGRVGLRGDWYLKKTEDLLLSRPVTTTSGFSSVFANVGNMENRGWELELSTVNLRPSSERGLRWTTAFNISHNENEVTALANDEPFNGGERSINRVEVGQPLGAFHAIRFLGVDPANGDAMYEEVIDPTTGERAAEQRQIVGSPHPDYVGGLTNQLSFAGFDLSVFFQFAQGHEIFNGMRLFSDAGGYYTDNQFRDVLRRWQEPGDITDQPRASYWGDSGARVISSRFIEDGSYVRLQDITLGYQLPASVAGLARMSNARIYVSGTNLHTWTDYSGYSPDVNSNGSSATFSLGTDFYAYPVARTFTIGISGAW